MREVSFGNEGAPRRGVRIILHYLLLTVKPEPESCLNELFYCRYANIVQCRVRTYYLDDFKNLLNFCKLISSHRWTSEERQSNLTKTEYTELKFAIKLMKLQMRSKLPSSNSVLENRIFFTKLNDFFKPVSPGRKNITREFFFSYFEGDILMFYTLSVFLFTDVKCAFS